MYCINCGKYNPEEANYCYHCGLAMNKEVPSPANLRQESDGSIEESDIAPMPECSNSNTAESKKPNGRKGLAITGMVFSIVGLAISVMCCVYFGSMLLGIACSAVGIILCALSAKNTDAVSIAVTGLIIGIIGVIIGVIMLVFLLAMLTSDTASMSFFDEFIEYFLYS